MDLLECNGKELSIASSIKQPIISCYRNNTRIPKYNSNNFNNLINGLLIISKNKNINLNEDDIRNTFKNCFKIDDIDFDIFKINFNNIINYLKINVSDLSKYIGFDSSFISKIKSGIRKPANLNEFVTKTSKFIINNYNNNLQELIKNEVNYNNLYTWLIHNKEENLSIHIKNNSKIYYDLNGYKEAILESLKQSTILNDKEIFLFNNMPITEINKDLQFIKQCHEHVNIILNKGIKLNVILNLERPINELTNELNFWIPLNMTGKINFYYLKDKSNVNKTIDYVSDNIILHGECILNNINTSKILVSNKKNDIKYYKDNMELIFSKVKPLIYNNTNIKNELNNNKR